MCFSPRQPEFSYLQRPRGHLFEPTLPRITTQIGSVSSAQGFWHPQSWEHASGTIPLGAVIQRWILSPDNQSFTLLQNESNTFVNNPLCDISLGSTSSGAPVELRNWRFCDSCVCVLGLFAVHLPPAFSPQNKNASRPNKPKKPRSRISWACGGSYANFLLLFIITNLLSL